MFYKLFISLKSGIQKQPPWRSDGPKLNIPPEYTKKVPTMQNFMKIGLKVLEELPHLSRKPDITIPFHQNFWWKKQHKCSQKARK